MAGDTLIDPAPSEVTKVASGVALGAPSSAPPPTRDARREIRRCVECQQQFSGEAMFCPFDGTKLATASWDPSKDSMLGKTVDGRYKLLSVLGEGGMGTVYEVQHTALNRSFAMKVLRRDVARDHELADRFTQEAKATAAVKHPNIVAITDFGRLDDETPYFVMELLSGETLADLIKRCGPLSPPRAARIVQQLAAGLRAAHEAGVVHRDLKPENVFLVGTPTAAPDAADDVRIVDFGAAKVAGAARLTKVGVVFGTPHYMSPEQASGQAVDHRADIYALGVIMYVMFTARVPFEADTYMGILTQHMFVQPTPPSRLLPDAGHALGALETVGPSRSDPTIDTRAWRSWRSPSSASSLWVRTAASRSRRGSRGRVDDRLDCSRLGKRGKRERATTSTWGRGLPRSGSARRGDGRSSLWGRSGSG
jgi:serine/threonine protein kinase